jgi:hypothetical protein
LNKCEMSRRYEGDQLSWLVRNEDGKPKEVPAVVVEPEKIGQRKFSRRVFLVGGGVVATGAVLDGVFCDFKILKRGFRELFRVIDGWGDVGNTTEVVEVVKAKAEVVPTATVAIEPQLVARINARQVVVASSLNGAEPVLIANVKESVALNANLRVFVRKGKNENNNQTLIAPVGLEELKIEISDGERIPIPSPIEVTYWDGFRTTLEAPSIIWDLIQRAAISTGVSPYLLLALLHSESSKFDCFATSPVGAEGCFQFMPGTWDMYGGGGNVWDPVANVIAAAKMIEAIGLVGKFEARNRGNFVGNFVGENKQACWNQDYRQARYVYDTAVALSQAAKARGDF